MSEGGKNSNQHPIRPASEGKQDQSSRTYAVTKKQPKAKEGKITYPSKTKKHGADTKKGVQRADSKTCEVSIGSEGSRHPTKEQRSRSHTQQQGTVQIKRTISLLCDIYIH